MDVDGCLDRTASALEECVQLNTADISAVDRTVISLKSISCELEGFVRSEVHLGPDQANFEELSMYVHQLCVEYETKLMFLLTLNPSHQVRSLTYGRRGRPRKAINLSFVSLATIVCMSPSIK